MNRCNKNCDDFDYIIEGESTSIAYCYKYNKEIKDMIDCDGDIICEKGVNENE